MSLPACIVVHGLYICQPFAGGSAQTSWPRAVLYRAAGEAGDSEGPAKSFSKRHALVLEIALETCNAKPLVLETVLRNYR